MEPEKIYVIRHLSYFYNDEWYKSFFDTRDHLGNITDLFDDKENAIQRWKQLEYDFNHQTNFQNILWCEYSNDEFYGQESYLAQKTVDELFNLIQKLECYVYGLYEYPKALKQQVFFDIQQQCYETCPCNTEDDVKNNDFIVANFIENDPLLTFVSPSTSDAYQHTVELKGSLEELSDTPLLLKNLIQNNPDLKFYDTYLIVKARALPQINPLLKKPIQKELHYLTIEEIYHLEQTLSLVTSQSHTLSGE